MGDRRRRWSRGLDNTDRQQISRRCAASSDHSAAAATGGAAATVTHACRCRWSRRCDWLWRLGFSELLGNRCTRRGRCDFVIIPAPTEIDDVRVVRVLKNAQKVSFAEALAVASEELARSGANLTRACRSAIRRFNGSANQVERILASES